MAGAIRLAGGRAEGALLDVTAGAAVDAFADRFASRHDRLDGLVHGAGALLADYVDSAEGFELTVATHVLGPYRLTCALSPSCELRSIDHRDGVVGRHVHRAVRDLDRLERDPAAHYDGVRAYARAKRAQVVLAHEWARRWSARGVASYAMHPGWVDTAVWLAAGATHRPRRQGGPPPCRSRRGSGTTDASAASTTCLGHAPRRARGRRAPVVGLVRHAHRAGNDR